MSPHPRVVAILRGITPGEALAVGKALYAAGIHDVEVPLNSPDPLSSISALRSGLPPDCRVGAGTVLRASDVRACHASGAQLIVSPNTDPRVISATLELGMESVPGASTPTEAFTAIEAGATSVKVFPGEVVRPAGLRAWRAVLPERVALLAVGGVSIGTIPDWLAAGAAGMGIGSTLYRPGRPAAEVAAVASQVIATVTAFQEEQA